jgi:hypothetical protein
MRSVVLIPLALAFAGLAGCASACAEAECSKAASERARLNQELAQFVKAYRVCLQKYEGDPDKAREICAVYTQALSAMEQKGLKLK